MQNALLSNVTDVPPQPREIEDAIAGADSPLESLTTDADMDAAIGRLNQALRAMARRIDSVGHSQSEATSVRSFAAQEINAAALDQAQAFQDLAKRIDQAERRAEPSAVRLEELLRSFGERIDATDRKTSAMLGELRASLGETARRLQAIENAMPRRAMPVQPLAAQPPAETLARYLDRSSDGPDRQPWPVWRRATAAAVVLGLAAAGVLMTVSVGNRQAVSGRTPLPKSETTRSPALGSAQPAPGAATASAPEATLAGPDSEALTRLTAQAAAGDGKAALGLGIAYADGDGVPEDDAEASRWLAEAALAGNAVAQYRLGTLYEKGMGVSADPVQAMSWYGEAARRGNRKAMHNLALLYADGAGAAKSYTDAARWFRAAADLGLTNSQFNLAVLYERGWGVPASLSEAYKWYAIAAAGGDAESKARIDAIAGELPVPDRQAAENGAKAFTPRPMEPAAN